MMYILITNETVPIYINFDKIQLLFVLLSLCYVVYECVYVTCIIALLLSLFISSYKVTSKSRIQYAFTLSILLYHVSNNIQFLLFPKFVYYNNNFRRQCWIMVLNMIPRIKSSSGGYSSPDVL